VGDFQVTLATTEVKVIGNECAICRGVADTARVGIYTDDPRVNVIDICSGCVLQIHQEIDAARKARAAEEKRIREINDRADY
jgi:hypothetical protein